MSMLSHFYRDLITQDRKQIAKSLYNTNYKNLECWMRCITDLRNRCAHYSRVYYWIFPAIPKMPAGEKCIPTRRLFAQLYILKLMYPNKEKWNNAFLNPLAKLVKNYKSDISLKHLAFPYHWKSLLKQQKILHKNQALSRCASQLIEIKTTPEL
ncbi:MAG: Abi family protein [Lachnospiraceae bacterium]|nr:Abi family protein [Lachnospiraceae bacterium]